MNTRWIISVLAIPLLFVFSCQRSEPESNITSTNTIRQASFYRASSDASVAVLSEGPQSIELRVRAGDLLVGTHKVHGQVFSTLDCDGCGWTNELGKPRLPVIRKFVEIPAGATVSATLSKVRESRSELRELGAQHLILPVQLPVEKTPGAFERTPFKMDEDLYSRDSSYPKNNVSISGPFVMRGHWLAMVEVYPVSYNPYVSKISYIHEAIVHLTFNPGNKAETISEKRYSPTFDRWFAANVINYQHQDTKGISTAKYAEGILVIAGDSYVDDAGLLNYLDARRAEGHFVSMVPMSTVGSSANDVRSYVISQYQSWAEPALSHVLIVGDTDDVPVHTGNGGGTSQVTDLYYASIDPGTYASDLLAPDLFVSRISVNDLTELSTYVSRADNYIYADFPNDTDWMTKFSFIASCDNNDITEGTHNYVISNYTSPLGYTGTYPNDPQMGGDQLYCAQGGSGVSTIQTALSDGRLVVNFSGHGGENTWADPSFGQSDLSGVQSVDASPFVISNACLTGSFAYSSGDCWGEMWLGYTYGAIIFWGASNSSYWDEDDILEKNLWDGVFQNNITRFSNITRNAKLETLAHYGANDHMEYYFEMYNILGDGTLDLYTDAPYDAMATYPTTIPLGVSQIDFSVSNSSGAVEGALVSARGLSVQQVGYTDASGQVSLILDPAPNTVGDLNVTITGHNMRRHEGTIQVIAANGPYLVHTSHEVTTDGSTPTTPNPGKHIVMPITVKNVGSDPAQGITGTVTTSSSDVTLTNDQVSFPDTAPEAESRSTTHLEFDIHADAVDASVAGFQLDWSTQDGYTGTTRFTVSIEKPNLLYVSHTVDDSNGGCDNDGIADTGEPSIFELTIDNQGTGDATGVLVSLSATGCVVDGPASIASIQSGAQAVASFVVTPQASLGCPAENVQFQVSATANESPTADVSSFTETLNADIASGSYSDDMEGTEPNGWSHSASQGTDDWGYVANESHSPSHSWFASDTDSSKDAVLVTPEITIGDTATLSFWQKFDFENNYDGGILEISTDGGNTFSNLGNYITQSGYNGTVSDWSSSPFSGQDVWTGTRNWQEVMVDLSSFGPGAVIIRFHLACDSSVGKTGWWIDDFVLDAETVVCQANSCSGSNEPPVANSGADQTVTEDDTVTLDGSGSYDPDGNPISFTWSQTAGPSVALSDPASESPTFTPPDVSENTVLTFSLVVHDWQLDSDPDEVNITVTPVNHAPVANAGADQHQDEGTLVTLDGSASTDPDGDTLEYTWTQISGPAVVLSDENAAISTFTAPDVEGYVDFTFELTVSDSEYSSSDEITVVIWGGCDDGLACTDDTLDGTTCKHEPTDCDDGNPCTVDTCSEPDGCTHEIMADCSLCGTDGVCMNGECQSGAQGTDLSCDDGDACTQNDVCRSGTCEGTDPVVCEAQDQCHVAGTCDPATGECSNPQADDGTACDDEDQCTQTDTCVSGTCTGSDPVVCEAQDQCHVAGTCDPASGQCSNPEADDGTACEDGDLCTKNDTCTNGTCSSGEPVQCQAMDECHLVGTCDPSTGECSTPRVEDGTACEAGTCQEGVCEEDASGCGCSHNSSSGSLPGLFLFSMMLFVLNKQRNF